MSVSSLASLKMERSGVEYRWTPLIRDPRSTCPTTGGPPVHPGGPRGSTYSRTSGPPPEQVDPHLLSYGSLARGPDGWSAGPVTSLGRARVRARG